MSKHTTESSQHNPFQEKNPSKLTKDKNSYTEDKVVLNFHGKDFSVLHPPL